MTAEERAKALYDDPAWYPDGPSVYPDDWVRIVAEALRAAALEAREEALEEVTEALGTQWITRGNLREDVLLWAVETVRSLKASPGGGK